MWCVLANPTSLLLQREQIFLFTLKTTKKDLTEHSRHKSFQRGRQGHNIIGCQMRKHLLVFTLNLLPKIITAFVFNSAVKNPSPVTPSIPFKMFHLCLISLTIIAFPKGKVPVCSVFSTQQTLQALAIPLALLCAFPNRWTMLLTSLHLVQACTLESIDVVFGFLYLQSHTHS